jgi:hypothetical protein
MSFHAAFCKESQCLAHVRMIPNTKNLNLQWNLVVSFLKR